MWIFAWFDPVHRRATKRSGLSTETGPGDGFNSEAEDRRLYRHADCHATCRSSAKMTTIAHAPGSSIPANPPQAP